MAKNELFPVARHHLRNRGVERAVCRKVHGRTVQRIARGALHIGDENRAPCIVLDAAHRRTSVMAAMTTVHGVARTFYLAEQSVCAKKGIITNAARDIVARLSSQCHKVALPNRGTVDAKK